MIPPGMVFRGLHVNRSTNLRRRYVSGVVLIFALLVGTPVFMPGNKPAPPLPFDSNVFVATTPPTFGPARNARLGERVRYFLFTLFMKLRGNRPSTWTFGPNPMTSCSIQGLLNQCMEVSGTRYLMPVGVAAGVVQFGNTNTLDGPHWVAAFEKALQSDGVQCLDPQTRRSGPEHLILLRFPAQKVVVVLPAKGADEFQRTNGIHITDPQAGQ